MIHNYSTVLALILNNLKVLGHFHSHSIQILNHLRGYLNSPKYDQNAKAVT